MEFADVVAVIVRDGAVRLALARETACEAALQTGVAGVLEVWEPDGSVTFEVSIAVPYGQVYVLQAN